MTFRFVLAVFLVAQLGTAGASADDVLRFDFGTPGSKLDQGFTKVTHETEFTPERGYGFRAIGGLVSRDRGGWEFGPSGRDSSVATHDFVEGRESATFRIRIGKHGGSGKHVVWVAVSDRLEAPPWFDIYCNGAKVQEVRVPRRNFVWFEPFEAEARDGLLDITFQGAHGFLVNAIVIGADPVGLQPVIDALERDIFFLPPEQQPNWRLIERPAAGPPYEPPPSQQQTGYVVFSVPYSVPVYPDSVPLPEQVHAPLRTIATPGETEPASCSVLALRELGRIDVTVSDLAADSGATIASDQIEVGVVRCWPQRVRGGMESSGTYMTKPELIEPPTARNSSVAKGTCKQWWLTLRVPPTAEPGLYRGMVTFRPEHAAVVEIPWLIRVLPFMLDRPVDRHWGTWWDGAAPPLNEIRGPASRGRNTPAEREAYARAEVADYRDHGFDIAILDCSYDVKETRHADGSWSFTLGSFAERMNWLKELKSPFAPVTSEYFCRRMEHRYADKPHVEGEFSPTARSACVSMFRFLDAEAKRHGWPPIIHMPIDEPGNNKTANRMRFAEQVLDMVREAGARTGCTLTDSVAANLGDRVRTRIYAWGHFNVARARAEAERGFPFWYYQNSIMYGESTLRSRGMTGFEFYRSGAQCATGWGFSAWRGNPHNDFDSASEDWFVLLPGLRKPTPTIYWELCREGVDDVRYLTTLRNAIDTARDQTDLRVAAARKVFDGIVAGDEIAHPEMFDCLRWRVAEQILSLKGHGDAPQAFVSQSQAIEWGENLFTNPGWESSRAEPCFVNHPPALTISQDVAHSGKYSLRWSGAEAADAPKYQGRGLLVVNVNVPAGAARELAGKLVKVGLWIRVDSGRLALGGARLRCFKNDANGQSVYAGGIEANSGVEDFSVWNKLEGVGMLPPDAGRLDLHLSCNLPDDLAQRKEVRFYIDDLFLQAHSPPPLGLELVQDDWFVGDVIRWNISHRPGVEKLEVSLLQDGRPVRQADVPGTGSASSSMPTIGLAPGIYTLVAAGQRDNSVVRTSRKIYLAASPFE